MLRTMTEAQKEQTKLSATYLNGLAIALAAIGGFAPVASFITSSSSAFNTVELVVALFVTCLVMSLCLHMMARAILMVLK